jgi:nitroreductase
LSIQKIITERRNIKKFKSIRVDNNQIKSWLETASMAPNHRMTEPWEILFIGYETRRKLNHKTNFGNAPVLLAILSKHGNSDVEKIENLEAVACFIQNFNLMAWESGIGTLWSSLGNSQSVRTTLDVSDEYSIVGIFGVGYPEELPEVKKRTPIEKKIRQLP